MAVFVSMKFINVDFHKRARNYVPELIMAQLWRSVLKKHNFSADLFQTLSAARSSCLR